MWWRIAYGALRILVGLAILKLVGTPVTDSIFMLMQHELSEDPHDLLYKILHSLITEHSFYFTFFLAFHFLFWGIIDIVLSYNILRHKIWALPLSLILMSGFIAYEIVRFEHNHSTILLGVIAIDIGILMLTNREYRRTRNSRSTA